MAEPVFAVGDLIECEMHMSGNPRWSGRIDHGGSGRWVQGRVVRLARDYLVFKLFNLGLTWRIPLPGHGDYSPSQWGRPGFLRKVQERPLEEACEAAAEAS